MPSLPPTFRPRGQRSRQEARRDHDRRRRKAKPWRKWYASEAWKQRRRAQLAAEPYCRRCARRGLDAVIATVANHIERHQGDWDKFINGPLESLCKPCHDGEVQREERAAERREGGSKSPDPSEPKPVP